MTKITVYGKPQRWMRPAQGRSFNGKNNRFTDKDVRAAMDVMRKKFEAMHQGDPWTGPVALRFVAVFAIPESWPAKTKAAAREGRVAHIADPDLDQLIKLVKDAAKGVVYEDDNQVCMYVGPPGSHGPAKRYGFPERTEVEFIKIKQDPDAITPGQRRIVKRQRDRLIKDFVAP